MGFMTLRAGILYRKYREGRIPTKLAEPHNHGSRTGIPGVGNTAHTGLVTKIEA